MTRPRARRVLALALLAPAATLSACGAFSADDRASDAPPVAGDAAAATDAGEPADGPREGDAVEAGLSYRDAVLFDRPRVYWRMGARSVTTVLDETGGGNHLLLAGGGHELGVAGAIAGDGDTAVHFNGTTSYAIAMSSRPLDFASSPFTVECWARRDAYVPGLEFNGDSQHLVSSLQGAGETQHGYAIYIAPSDSIDKSTAYLGGASADAGTAPLREVNQALTPVGVWTHHVMTFDGASMTYYVNGLPAGTKKTGFELGVRKTDLTVGASSGKQSHFEGAIDEVALYDHALSPERIAAHYGAGG